MVLKFLATDDSARLSRWLRLTGYDAALTPSQPLSQLYQRAYNEGPIVVTRNRRVRESRFFRVIHLQHHDVEGQLRQL